jgi:RES domain-containing protein
LSVPSAVIPIERNLLLNPLHPAIAQVRITDDQPFSFDPRLLRDG